MRRTAGRLSGREAVVPVDAEHGAQPYSTLTLLWQLGAFVCRPARRRRHGTARVREPGRARATVSWWDAVEIDLARQAEILRALYSRELTGDADTRRRKKRLRERTCS
jgi:hypothetical protein